MKRIIAVILSLITVLSAAACTPLDAEQSLAVETTDLVSDGDGMKEKMDSALKKHSFEGIVYLTKNGKVVYQSATGTDENGNALTVDSTMYIGSMSKQFCAAAVMLLSEQGKLSLNDTLDAYFPEYSNGKDITIKNLLSMRSGIPDMANKEADSACKVEGVSADNSATENNTLIKEWIFNQPLEFEPNSTFEYCNSNYFLLSNIVELASGESYSDFIRQNIFEPLGMTHTGFINEIKTSPAWSDGLTYDTFTAGEATEGLTRGAGDIASNAADMDKWMTALNSGKIISIDSYREMVTNYSVDSAKGYGYGMFVSFFGGVGHSGMIGSYTSIDYINEEKGYNLFAACNKSYMEIENLPSVLLGDYLD